VQGVPDVALVRPDLTAAGRLERGEAEQGSLPDQIGDALGDAESHERYHNI